MTRTRFVPLALTAAVVGALSAPAMVQAADNDLTCSASAARVLALVEPVKITGECATQSKQLATFGTGLLSTVEVRVTALHASTVRSGSAPGAATATALADEVRIALPGVVVEATNLRATADASCAAGHPALATGGSLGSLTINGRSQQLGTGPVEIPLGIATLRLNHTEARDGGVARRALQLSSLLGDVTIAEAKAGTKGTPCRTEPDPDPAPHSVVTKTVDAPDGSRVGSRDAAPGDGLTYRMTYENEGDATARDVVVTDVLDRQAPGACEPACSQDGGTVSWQLGDVGPGETRELSLQAQLPATASEAGTAVFRNRAVAQDHTGSSESGEVQVRVRYQPQIVVEHTHYRFYYEGYDLPTTDPIVITDMESQHRSGVTSVVTLQNEGTAPATELVLRDRLADAYSDVGCSPGPGAGCTVEADATAPAVLDPAGTGSVVRFTEASLAIGETTNVEYGGTLASADYADEANDVSARPVLNTAQGEVAVPAREVTVQAAVDLYTYVESRIDRNGDGDYVDLGEDVKHDEAVPVARLLELELYASQFADRAAYDTYATLTLPASLAPVGDPCAGVEDGLACAYDAGTRTLRLDKGRLAGLRDAFGHRFVVRTQLPKGTLSLTSTVSSTQQSGVVSEAEVFRVV